MAAKEDQTEAIMITATGYRVQPQNFHAFGAEDLIEGGGELAVAIAEQDLSPHGAVGDLAAARSGQNAGLRRILATCM